ncbi:MAG TPA: peptide ABC transporter permease, partial [Rhodospirillum rubrum]|nr:peptide ABC transporter permease [Rhodospirillum rubrum]
MKAVLRTLLATATTLFGLLFVTFLISRMLPADPVLAVVGDHASQALVDRTRIELGLDKPLLVQFGLYIGNVLQGDLGQSVRTGEPIASELARVFPATLELATLGTLIGVLAGVPLGILAALRKDTLIDHLVRFIGLMGYSFPIFWLGLMGLLVFYATLGVLPGPGRLDFGYEDFVTPITGLMTIDTLLAGDMDLFRNALAHLILPAGLLGYYSLAYICLLYTS